MKCLALCLALVGATTSAYGQNQQQASVPVNGGRVVGVFIPDGQIAPAPDPAFREHQHHGPVCIRRVCPPCWWGLPPWNQGFVGYRPPLCLVQRTPIAGFGVNVFGIGGSVAVTKSRYYGDPGYGGLGYPSQPVRPW